MNIRNDSDGNQTAGEDSVPTAAALHLADDRQTHFVVPWRLKPDPRQALRLQGDDAGCGSCPVD